MDSFYACMYPLLLILIAPTDTDLSYDWQTVQEVENHLTEISDCVQLAEVKLSLAKHLGLHIDSDDAYEEKVQYILQKLPFHSVHVYLYVDCSLWRFARI